MSRAAIALSIAVVSCDRPAPITRCDQDLTGTYDVEGRRWMLLDTGLVLEAYPLFADVPRDGELEIAPRLIELERDAHGIAGVVQRRYMQGSAVCVSQVTARITACAGDTLDVVLADPVTPLQFEGPFSVELEPTDDLGMQAIGFFGLYFQRRVCLYPRPDVSRRERWHRVLTP